MERIAAAPQTANPLYLRALLEELRLWHEHETLEGRIDHYLSATTVAELYQRILERYEQDYERDCPGLVRDAMSLLWAARRGLSEAELMDLLGSDGQPLPRAHWSPLYLAAEQSLVNRSGLAEAQSWERLATVLTEPSLFGAAWERNQFEVKAYWTKVEDNSPQRMVEAYRPVLDAPDTDTSHTWRIAILLGDTGHPEEAFTLRNHLAEQFAKRGDQWNLAATYGNQAVILQDLGKLDEAMALLKETERLCRELGDKAGLVRSLCNQARTLKDWGKLEEAMALLKETERLCRELGDKAVLLVSLGSQARIVRDWGKLEEAMALLKETERLCRELGDKASLQASLGNQALILRDWGKLEEAMALLKEEEQLCREVGDKRDLQASLGNQTTILRAWGKLEETMALLKEQERLCRELGDPQGLATSLYNQAIFFSQGVNWMVQGTACSEALPRVEEAYQLAKDHGLTEIRHAVLERKELYRRSFFYLRDPRVPREGTPAHVYSVFVQEDARQKLEALKQNIAGTHRPVRYFSCEWRGDHFENLDAFGQVVLEDLWSGVLRDCAYVSPDVWREVLGHDSLTDPLFANEHTPVPEAVWREIVARAKPRPREPLVRERDEMGEFAQDYALDTRTSVCYCCLRD